VVGGASRLLAAGEEAMKPGITGDGVRFGLHWIASEPNPALRGIRASVFLYKLTGHSYFPGCGSVADICREQRIPRSSFYALSDELAAFGLSLHSPGKGILDSIGEDNSLVSEELRHEEENPWTPED